MGSSCHIVLAHIVLAVWEIMIRRPLLAGRRARVLLPLKDRKIDISSRTSCRIARARRTMSNLYPASGGGSPAPRPPPIPSRVPTWGCRLWRRAFAHSPPGCLQRLCVCRDLPTKTDSSLRSATNTINQPQASRRFRFSLIVHAFLHSIFI